MSLSTIKAEQFITFRDTKEDPCGSDPYYISCSEVKYLFFNTTQSSNATIKTTALQQFSRLGGHFNISEIQNLFSQRIFLKLLNTCSNLCMYLKSKPKL